MNILSIKILFNRTLLMLSFLIVLIFAGCASTPSASNKAHATDELDTAIRNASDYLNSNIPHGSKIVIINIQSNSTDLSEYIIDELIANAVNDKLFDVVDRQQLDLIRTEQNFQVSGEVDDNTALTIGRFVGAQTIVSGTLRNIGNQHRIAIRALEVQTARVQGQFNKNIASSKLITEISASNNAAAPAATVSAAATNAASGAATSANSSAASRRQSQTAASNNDALPAAARGAAVLQSGSVVSGHIAVGGEYWYMFTTTRDGFLAVETFGNIDTYLHAYNINMEEVSVNDDGGDNKNARLEMLVGANQTYFFKLRGYEADHTAGAYRILANYQDDNRNGREPNTKRSQASLLRLNQSTPITFTFYECRWFYYEVPRYGTLTIFTEGSIDTRLALYDSYGRLITHDDDSGNGRNARISRNLNPGIYFIDVCEYRGRLNSETTLHGEFR